jgi:drug/metabolite transporter (DMT)-like permease
MSEQRKAVRAIIWGITASLFLSSTFIINSLISGSGGHWAWTAALRSIFLIPILGLVVFLAKQLRPTIAAIKAAPMVFIKWGVIGFGCLYTTLAVASLWSPGWMIAAAFQINILAGILLAPVIYPDERKIIPRRSLIISLIILAGVFIMQFEKLTELHSVRNTILSFFIVVLGAIVWPLGNRRLMVDLEYKGIQLNALQRVLGMSLGCLPLLIILAIIGFTKAGAPPLAQCESSFLSAVFSGFLGGVGFYQATQIVSKNTVALAAIEATQVFEILFTLIGEMVLQGTQFPGFYAQIGFFVILLGISIHFWNTWRHCKGLVNPMY